MRIENSSNYGDDLVSVIIPTYNRSSRLRRSLISVVAQTYRPIEIVVVDDGSVDNTADTVEEFILKFKNSDPRLLIKYVVQPNSGAPTARNTGIKSAKGRYLQFLDSDDLLMPTKIFEQVKLLKTDCTPICLCDYLYVDENDTILRKVFNNVSIKQIIRHFVGVSTSVPLVDRKFFKPDDLMWNTNLKRMQDIDYYVKLFLLVNDFSYLNKFLFKLVVHEEGRITTSVKNNVYWPIFKSIFLFGLNNFNRISRKKHVALVGLCLMLVYRSLGIGKFPGWLKFWMSRPPERIVHEL